MADPGGGGDDDVYDAGVGGSQGEEEEYIYDEDDGGDAIMSDAEELAAAAVSLAAATSGVPASGVAGAGDGGLSGSGGGKGGPASSPQGAGASSSASSSSSSAAAAASMRPRLSIGAGSGQEYRLVAPSELERERARMVGEVSSVLSLPPEAAGMVLAYFKWNKERVLDAYTADPSAVGAAVGIGRIGQQRQPPSDFMCNICLDDRRPSEGFQLGCGHPFCKPCWEQFLLNSVADAGPQCVVTRCPESGCAEGLPFSVVAALGSPETVAKWARFALQQFVDVNKTMVWCPGAGCTNAFVASRGPVKTVFCTCGCKFCFKCAQEAHEPVGCASLSAWDAKCRNESETVNWLVAHTKPCPKCSARIEKNQGCNHMRCQKCKHEFCWICMGPWAEHGSSYYKCNKFTDSKSSGDSDKERARLENERYIFYYTRYDNHHKAGLFAAKHREAAQRRMTELQESGGLAYSDVTFLNDATEALLECRRVLKYTYVFGYYLKDGPEKQLFEYLQEKLERSTEELAELTERPVDRMDRSQVVNFTRVTLTYLRNMIDGIDEGLTSAGGASGSGAGASGVGAGASSSL